MRNIPLAYNIEHNYRAMAPWCPARPSFIRTQVVGDRQDDDRCSSYKACGSKHLNSSGHTCQFTWLKVSGMRPSYLEAASDFRDQSGRCVYPVALDETLRAADREERLSRQQISRNSVGGRSFTAISVVLTSS